MEGYWFRSPRFRPLPGEDRETAPGVYGRELAHWLRDGLRAKGYARARAEACDWGWCVIVRYRPWLLWVGCGGLHDAPEAGGRAHAGALLWHCHAAVERRGLRRWCGRHASDAALRELDLALRGLLLADPDIQQVDPP